MGVHPRALGEVQITIATHLWLHWVRIGVEHAGDGRDGAGAADADREPSEAGSSAGSHG